MAARAKDVTNALSERCGRKLGDLREAAGGAVSIAAVLHRPPQLPADGDEIAGRSRARAVDNDRIAGVGHPRARQAIGMEDRQGVGKSAGAVAGGAEQIKPFVVPNHGRVAEFEAGQQGRVTLPSVGKFDAPIERQIPVLRTLRYHPQFTVRFDEKRIGQMPRLFQDRGDRPARPAAVERDRRDDAFADAMIEILEEDERAALPCHGKRIGIETMSRIGDDRPRRAGQIPG
jgi:hypothetical protein